VGIVAFGIFFYFFVRGLVDARATTALTNSLRIIDLEQALGLYHEPALQERFMRTDWMVTLQNWIYIFGHWPVVIGTLVWLVWRHPGEYRRFRNAMVISGLIGIVIFAAFPVAPPRLVPNHGFWDSVTARSDAYRVLQPPALTNPYAAVPSLHFGWNLLMGMAWFRNAESRLGKLFGVIMPPLMFMAIVLTANHFIFDGIAGASLALFALFVASLLHRHSVEPIRRAPVRPREHMEPRPAKESHGTASPPPA